MLPVNGKKETRCRNRLNRKLYTRKVQVQSLFMITYNWNKEKNLLLGNEEKELVQSLETGGLKSVDNLGKEMKKHQNTN